MVMSSLHDHARAGAVLTTERTIRAGLARSPDALGTIVVAVDIARGPGLARHLETGTISTIFAIEAAGFSALARERL